MVVLDLGGLADPDARGERLVHLGADDARPVRAELDGDSLGRHGQELAGCDEDPQDLACLRGSQGMFFQQALCLEQADAHGGNLGLDAFQFHGRVLQLQGRQFFLFRLDDFIKLVRAFGDGGDPFHRGRVIADPADRLPFQPFLACDQRVLCSCFWQASGRVPVRARRRCSTR